MEFVNLGISLAVNCNFILQSKALFLKGRCLELWKGTHSWSVVSGQSLIQCYLDESIGEHDVGGGCFIYCSLHADPSSLTPFKSKGSSDLCTPAMNERNEIPFSKIPFHLTRPKWHFKHSKTMLFYSFQPYFLKKFKFYRFKRWMGREVTES